MLAMKSSNALAAKGSKISSVKLDIRVCVGKVGGKLTDQDGGRLGHFANIFIGLHDLLDSGYWELALCRALHHLARYRADAVSLRSCLR